MEYLAETGDHFFSSGVITYCQKDNEESDEEVGKDNIMFNDFRDKDLLDIEASTEQSSLFSSWSTSLSNLLSSSLQKKSNKHSGDSSSILSKLSESGVTRNKMSILAHKISKQCPNGDLFSGYVDSITGKPVYGRRVFISSGEIYEGPFSDNGMKHGKNSVCTHPNGNKFIGTYSHDVPVEGCFVTPEWTYTGKFSRVDYENIRKNSGLGLGLPSDYSSEFLLLFDDENGCLAYKNGDTYKGGFKNGFFHGGGWHNTKEFLYKGEFKKGERHGTGTLTCSSTGALSSLSSNLLSYLCLVDCNSVDISYKYTGIWSNGMKEDMGNESISITINNDDSSNYLESSFTGSFHQNCRYGNGELTLWDGLRLEGMWRCNLPIVGSSISDITDSHQRWRITYPNGNVYDGECSYLPTVLTKRNNTSKILDRWFTSEPPKLIHHGFGIMFYSESGDFYAGKFRDGIRHGKGTCICQCEGDQYTGLWINDAPNDPQLITLPLYQPVSSLHFIKRNHNESDEIYYSSNSRCFIPKPNSAIDVFEEKDTATSTTITSSASLSSCIQLQKNTRKRHIFY